jgi:hypothetical protein
MKGILPILSIMHNRLLPKRLSNKRASAAKGSELVLISLRSLTKEYRITPKERHHHS